MTYDKIPVYTYSLNTEELDKRYEDYKNVFVYDDNFVIPKNIEIILMYNNIDMTDKKTKIKIYFLSSLLKDTYKEQENYNQQLGFYLLKIGKLEKKN